MQNENQQENPASSSEQLELAANHPSTEKAEKIERQRLSLLNAIAASRLDTMQEKVAWILNHHPETRDSDIELQLWYWRQFESDLIDDGFIAVKNYYRLTRLTSIARERARVQNV